tara:strand:- start:420 stop:734 length:315 start_codon:yes stop_codon:yes gene_type:complete
MNKDERIQQLENELEYFKTLVGHFELKKVQHIKKVKENSKKRMCVGIPDSELTEEQILKRNILIEKRRADQRKRYNTIYKPLKQKQKEEAKKLKENNNTNITNQ